jgi:hypothetical protein
MEDFASGSDLTTFEGYLKYQFRIDAANLTAKELDQWHLRID